MTTKKEVQMLPQKQVFKTPSVNLMNSLVCTNWLLKVVKEYVQRRSEIPGETSQALKDPIKNIAFQW